MHGKQHCRVDEIYDVLSVEDAIERLEYVWCQRLS